MKNPNNLLTATVAAFEQWRTTREHPKQTTPRQLQRQAVALLAHFSSPQIVAKLNISGTNLKRWAEYGQEQHNHEVGEFITLPHVEQPQSSQLNLELAFGNGCLMRLCGNISPAQLTAITQSVTAHGRTLS